MWATTGLLAACLLCGQVDAAPAPDLERRVAELVRQLDAPEKATRESAERSLLELGHAALAVLPATTSRTPAETALRLDRVRATLEKQAAAATVRSSTVTLRGKQLPLADVLTAIEKQTGNKVIDFRPNFGEPVADVHVDVDWQQTAFWSAIDQLLDRGGLQIYDHAGADGLALVTRHDPRALAKHVDDVEAFRVEALSFDARRDLAGSDEGNLTLQFEVSWEPRLHPILLLDDADAFEAEDDRGRKIPLAQATSKLELPIDKGSQSVRLPLHFALPPRDARQMKSLRGRVSLLLPGAIEQFRFDDLTAKRVEKKSAGATVVFEQAVENNDLWEVRLLVSFERADQALESHQTWIFNNEVWIESPDNEKLSVVGYQTTRQTKDQLGLAYFFDLPKGPAGHKLVYQTPTAIQSVPIEFELRDLELP